MQAARFKNTVSSNLIDQDRFKEFFSDQLEHAKTRTFILSIIKDYVGSVEFMDKSSEYAGREFDKRLLNSTKFWAGFLSTTILAAILTSLITLAIKN